MSFLNNNYSAVVTFAMLTPTILSHEAGRRTSLLKRNGQSFLQEAVHNEAT